MIARPVRGMDASMPVEHMPSRFCARKIPRGGAKRYMSQGPLFGYMLGCPGCGFIELHQHEVAHFVEEPGAEPGAPPRLVSADPVLCMLCRRTITVAGGVITAVLG